MVSHELELKNIAIVTVVLSVILSIFLMLVLDVSPKYLYLKVGLVTTCLTIFWYVYDKYLWKIGAFRLNGWLCSTPDVSGRWEGCLDRDGEGCPHKFVVEIYQTMTTIKLYTYSSRSKGESISVKFTKDQLGGKYKLITYWRTNAGALSENQPHKNQFHGLSEFDIILNKGSKQLDGIYFTNRNPATKGSTNLTWKGSDPIGKFE